MNVQDTAFKFAHPLRVRVPQKFIKKKRSNTEVSLLFWRAARDTGGKPPCVLGDRRMATVPASHFATKNSPQDCFLNVAHPLRVRVPFTGELKMNVRNLLEKRRFAVKISGIKKTATP